MPGARWLALIAAATLGAQEKGYVGADACRACHPAQFAGQSASGHARTLYRAAQHPLAASFAAAESLRRAPSFRFQFLRTAGGLRVRADDGRYVTDLPIEWAFGAGRHAVTFVSKVSGEFYLEHSFSYYPDTGRLDLTPRHDALPATTLHQAMGQAIPIRGSGPTVADCFGCHSTGPVSVAEDGEVRITEAGVRCEVCHGPGADHVKAPGRRDSIRNPKRLPSTELNQFCGTCHRSLTASFDWNSPWNVRHQPPYLARSACFRKSNGGLSCLTCHDPHERVRRDDAAYYSRKCATCHHAGTHPPQPVCKAQEAPDCTSCHMPVVAASSHLRFKNHWIGVYHGAGSRSPGCAGILEACRGD